VASSCSPDHHQHRCRQTFFNWSTTSSAADRCRRLEHIEVGGKERGAAFRDQFGMGRLEVRREQPAHGDVGDGLKALARRAPRHVAGRLSRGFGKSGAAVGKDQPLAMPDGRNAICRTTKAA